MSWGYKILIVYSIFVAGIVFMVVRSSYEKADLVTPDYYAQELKYQQKIDEAKRADGLSAAPAVAILNDQITIGFPKEFDRQQIKGTATLYCPSDEAQDIKKDFAMKDEAVVLAIPVIHKKLYQLQLSWLCNGTSYYYEKKIKL
jgi:hypothetical protein